MGYSKVAGRWSQITSALPGPVFPRLALTSMLEFWNPPLDDSFIILAISVLYDNVRTPEGGLT
jgi:hypothetical protein